MRKVCPKCGSTRFIANQTRNFRVVVDGSNTYEKDEMESPTYVSTPYGPYVCANCRSVYGSLNALKESLEYNRVHISGRKGENFELKLPDGTTRDMIGEILKNVLHKLNRITHNEMAGFYRFEVFNEYFGQDQKHEIYGVAFIDSSTRKVDLRITEPDKAGEKEADRRSDPSRSRAVWISIRSLSGRNLRYGGTIKQVEDHLYAFIHGYTYLFRDVVEGRTLTDEAKEEEILIMLRDINRNIEAPIFLSREEYNLALVRYKSYEPQIAGKYSEGDLIHLYRIAVKKQEYPDFECWKTDMLKSGVFEQIQ